MNITLASKADEQRWDDYVSAHPSATPYHRFAWGKACEEAYGQPMHYLIAADDSNCILGVLPSIDFKKPLTASKMIALPFCDSGFALADNTQIKSALLAHLPSTSDYRDLLQTPAQTTELSPGQKVILRLPLPSSSREPISWI